LEQVAAGDAQRARIDWLRFTVPLGAVVHVDALPALSVEFMENTDQRCRDLVRDTRSSLIPVFGAMYAARAAAKLVSRLLGAFDVGDVEGRGTDFYTARCSLTHEGHVVGYCLAGGNSSAQSQTVHVNLFGEAALHLSHANYRPVREFIEESGGWITRCDIAVDVFHGDDITAVPDAFMAGEFDVRGKRPSQAEAGSWSSGHSRTFYVGKRESGKLFRAYEKGDQLLGPESNDAWIRYEVEFRNQSRVIDPAVLDRPGDFFAGAYPFCEALMNRLQASACPSRIPTVRQLVDRVAHAAATRVARWVRDTAGPSVVALFEFGGDLFESLVLDQQGRKPRRLAGFSRASLIEGFGKVAEGLALSPVPFANQGAELST
jgi:phage replication initiation protein